MDNVVPAIPSLLIPTSTGIEQNISPANAGSVSPEAVEKFNAILQGQPADSIRLEGTTPTAAAPTSVDSIFSNLSAGGMASPAELLRAQMELTSLQLNWIITSQVASRVGSGVQTVLNNQV